MISRVQECGFHQANELLATGQWNVVQALNMEDEIVYVMGRIDTPTALQVEDRVNRVLVEVAKLKMAYGENLRFSHSQIDAVIEAFDKLPEGMVSAP